MIENFPEALRRVLKHEGGYTNDPRDPGGPTNFGITIADVRMYVKKDATAQDVKNLPLQVAKNIYKQKYWNAVDGDNLPPGVDYAVFDFGVNSGVSRALRYYKPYKDLPPAEAVANLCDDRLQFLKGLKTWPTFGKGWGTRVAEVRSYGIQLAKGAVPPPPDIPKPEQEQEPNPPPQTKPIVKSKTFWGSIISALTAIGGAISDPKNLAIILGALIIVGIAGYIIWERNGKPDIRGWFK